MSTVYSIRIPKKLRQALETLKHVDWQQELRHFIEQKASEQYLRMGLEEARKLRSEMKETVSSAEIIRADRKDAH